MNKNGRAIVWAVSIALVFITLGTYWGAGQNDFVSYDDNVYVTENPNVNKGLSLESVVWAFTTLHAETSYWHPLTWLSHMLDCQLFGLKPFGHHMTNLLLHILNTLLLFWVLKRMTGSLWPSAFVAAAFALHPLHVESVAWVAERKDVLSGFFWMLTICAYVRYVERPGVGRYLLVIMAFCLGLMSKPMVVTLPCVLLLLDWWPLRRFDRFSNRRLVAEKIPLFVLAAILSVITWIAQQGIGTMSETDSLGLGPRICNAMVSYVSYIHKMVWPSRLAVLYPYPPDGVGLLQPIVSFILLAAVSAGVIFASRKRRYLAVGWLWYLGTLVPVIGLVQVGLQARADRYTYLPIIGLFIMVGWGVGELSARWHNRRLLLAVSGGLLLVAMAVCSRMQIRYWKDSSTLFERAVNVTQNNYIMHSNLGDELQAQGRMDEAIGHYLRAVKIRPNYAVAHHNLGIVLGAQGKLDEAMYYYRQALQLEPNYEARTWYNFGRALQSQGRLDDAISYYRRALDSKEDLFEARYNLGVALQLQGRLDESISHYRLVVKADPGHANAYNNLGLALQSQGNIAEAIDNFHQALKARGDHVLAHVNLVWVLVTAEDEKLRDPAEAVRVAERACELTNFVRPDILDTLGVAYAAAGRFAEAIKVTERALGMAEAAKQEKIAEDIRGRLELYKNNKPYRN